MTLGKIVTIPDPILRKKARKVTGFGSNLQKLIDDMIETMRAAPGVGLAAPQINIPLRVIVVEYGEVDEEGEVIVPTKLYSLANPEISRFSDNREVGTEGCLSIPGIAGDVERPEGVTVKGYNRHGQPVKIKTRGWLSRIFQHEIDHLNGVLFTDLAERVWRLEEETAAGQVILAD